MLSARARRRGSPARLVLAAPGVLLARARRGGALARLVTGAALALAACAPRDGSLERVTPPVPRPTALALDEPFGVAHPAQLVPFDLPAGFGPGPVRVVDADGEEVPAQRLAEGGVLVLTDLPAGAARRWRALAGPGTARPLHPVTVTARRTHYEVDNGLTGVRVPRFGSDLARVPAPLQGIRLRDGAWTARGPSWLRGLDDRPLAAAAAGVRFLERGPLRVRVEVAYRLAPRPGAGGGEYRATIEVQADRPSVLLEEESDAELRYDLDAEDGVRPDRGRYRLFGRDETVALPRGPASPGAPFLRPLTLWHPWVRETGWYWQLYDSTAGPDANVLGVFAGRASRALGAAASGPAVVVQGRGPGQAPLAGVRLELRRRLPDGRVFPRVRVSWGLFAGVKGRDLPEPDRVQPIARQMNVLAGVRLATLHAARADWRPRPAVGLYLPPERERAILARLREDEAYARALSDEEPPSRPLLRAWRDAGPDGMRPIVDAIDAAARGVLTPLVHGDGIHDFGVFYWHGGLTMSRLLPWIHAVLADPRASDDDRARVRAAAALFGAVLWDDDFVPLFGGHGIHLGTENMPVQQAEYRSQYALLLADAPAMRARAARVPDEVRARLRHVVTPEGAHMSSPHYVGASMGPLLTTLQQLQQRGVDLAATEARLPAFAGFLLGLLTPPEVRFGGLRKLVSIGDGATEASELLGQLGTALAAARPELSARLMGAWRLSGSPRGAFHGSTVLKIDDALPRAAPGLSTRQVPAWYSVLRSGVGTAAESAVWLVHGRAYRDHYHADNGGVVVYALGAPVALDWGSTYAPRAGGAMLHSVVLPERLLEHPWDADGPPLDAGRRWTSAGETLLAFEASSHARAELELDGHAWTRAVDLVHPDPERPVVVIRDRLRAPGPGARHVLTLNLAAEGPVDTPAGPLSPVPRLHGERPELPSAGPVFALPPGLARLRFRGAWGVDWDLHVASAGGLAAQVGSWGHRSHPTREAVEFERAHGRRFEERQHVLRIRGADRFATVLVPYRRGSPPPEAAPADGMDAEVRTAAGRLLVAGDGHLFEGGGATVVTATGAAPWGAGGVRIEGGPAEVRIAPGGLRVTAHGPPGERRITLPPGCAVGGVPAPGGAAWRLPYAGGPAVTFEGRCGGMAP